MADLFITLFIIHLVIDFPLQPTWIAMNKHKIGQHPAGWVHAAMHAAGASLVLPWQYAIVLGLMHLLIDTYALVWLWLNYVRPEFHPDASPQHLAAWPAVIWTDQTFHLLSIFLVVGAVT